MDFKQDFDSKEELLFSYYISELLDKGFLLGAEYQPKSFELSIEATVEALESNKKSETIKSITLMRSHAYRCDWCLKWDDSARGILFWEKGGSYSKNFFPYRKTHAQNFIPFYAENNISYIDVKGEAAFNSNNSAITFPVNQKWTLDKFGIFVQKIVVSLSEKGIFARTFTPRSVVVSEVYKVKTKKNDVGDSKLKYEPILLEQWIKQKQHNT